MHCPRRDQRYVVVSCVTLLFLFVACGHGKAYDSPVYSRLRTHIDSIRVINTHEHQGYWGEYSAESVSFYTHLAVSYLNADLVSAGAPEFKPDVINEGNLDELWDMYGRYLDLCRNTSYYGSFIKGFQALYDFDDPHFTKANVASLSRRISKNYGNLDKWYGKAFSQAGFELMFVDTLEDRFDPDLDPKYFAEVFSNLPIVWSAGERRRLTVDKNPVMKGWIEEMLFKYCSVYADAQKNNVPISSFDDYLAYADQLFQKALDRKAVAVKNVLAYMRSLNFADSSYERAKAVFDKSAKAELSNQEKKEIQDFMVHWTIRKSSEYGLPIQIHTGYLAGNENTLSNSLPLDLNRLFLKYPEVKFVLFHGSYPWTGEFCALGKMFPNVYLDLVWLPQISRSEAMRTFDEMLDTVPYNKFFWGGDCAMIEESTGSLEYGKEVVAQVLAARVERGLMTEDVAYDVARRIFRENAIHFFRLGDRLNKQKTGTP